MITEQDKRDFRSKIKVQLNCSPKPTFAQRIYREYISWILRYHPKYIIISCQSKGNNSSISIKNLLMPHYSKGVSNQEVKDRVLRWFKWYRKITEGRKLIINKDEWYITYR